jgi:ATP cone domain/Restriction endonuclease
MKKYKNVSIIKSTGDIVPFYPDKLKRSLLKSGASEQQAENIIRQVQENLYEGITTKKIYQQAFQLLRGSSKPLAAKYKLKRAITELGPTGFPFEKYIAAIFEKQGYNVETGVIAEGHCVKHEIDVIAKRDNEFLMIECKFHHSPGIVCDVKIPLYIHSRFLDVKEGLIKLAGHNNNQYEVWVVTNTRFTSDAIQYGVCMGMNLLGWDYPAEKSLNKLIDESGLYPVTTLITLSANEKQILLNNRVVLCKNILGNEKVLEQAGISSGRINTIISEVRQLCGS